MVKERLRKIELLAPAKNLECGIAAIDHGADAVYIGASKFGARQAAGNSVADIRKLCDYAHQFGVAVHVTMNTIVYDEELEEMRSLIRALDDAGIDALLIQDMGLLKVCRDELNVRFALHASTQCDSRSVAKVKWLKSLGFERVVLARELSVAEITQIHRSVPDVELEAFVHGALCVSYSGICYASEHCFGRSANRGACSQFCRMPFDLKDAEGKLIEKQRYLLSLKDMCQIDNLEPLMRSGACSFKIEGRLKDINYVKNIVSAYSQRLNEIIAENPDAYCRASHGQVEYGFTPNLNKTFNRGYTSYFLSGRQRDIFSPNTPKALGEYVGKVKEIRKDSFSVSSTAAFANGDGLCFINKVAVNEGRKEVLEGFRVNKAVGNRLYPLQIPKGLVAGTALYRNQDQLFEKELSGKTATRRLPLDMFLQKTTDGYALQLTTTSTKGEGVSIEETVVFQHQEAQKQQTENILKQLTKLGNTIFFANRVSLQDGIAACFIPSSVLAELRRMAVEKLLSCLPVFFKKEREKERNSVQLKTEAMTDFSYINPREYERFSYLYNIANAEAYRFYEAQGLKKFSAAFECLHRKNDKFAKASNGNTDLLMQCRHCIRYSLGYCIANGGKKPTWKEPLYLEMNDKRKFRLEFDCKNCEMKIFTL
ncbi:MAG: U32 family peptidase [Prevotella sp.]|nr:U32 family peptidase [Prevotellaceae bacterium]MDY3936545.1 U32 family peptidase [Prevotella sp.]